MTQFTPSGGSMHPLDRAWNDRISGRRSVGSRDEGSERRVARRDGRGSGNRARHRARTPWRRGDDGPCRRHPRVERPRRWPPRSRPQAGRRIRIRAGVDVDVRRFACSPGRKADRGRRAGALNLVCANGGVLGASGGSRITGIEGVHVSVNVMGIREDGFRVSTGAAREPRPSAHREHGLLEASPPRCAPRLAPTSRRKYAWRGYSEMLRAELARPGHRRLGAVPPGVVASEPHRDVRRAPPRSHLRAVPAPQLASMGGAAAAASALARTDDAAEKVGPIVVARLRAEPPLQVLTATGAATRPLVEGRFHGASRRLRFAERGWGAIGSAPAPGATRDRFSAVPRRRAPARPTRSITRRGPRARAPSAGIETGHW